MRFGSVCSGIEAASVALHPLGWQAAWLAEIEPFPSAVLAHHYPDVPNLGDMTTLPGMVLRGEIEAPDVLIGGTPCQAFSVAGMRRGMADPRGLLTIRFVELADAIDHVRAAAGLDAGIVWWENVPGVLSDKENAFGCFLAALVGESDPLQPSGGRWTDAGAVYGPKRNAAWRILDAQYFGLAQRRRRVFVVASAGDGFDPGAVLFESGGVRRHPPARGEAGQGTAGRTGDGAAGGRGGWPADVACTLNAAFGDKQGLEDQHALSGAALFVPHVSPCLETQAGTLRQPCTQAYVVTPPLTSSMATPLGNGGKDSFVVPMIAHTPLAAGAHPPAVATSMDVRRLTPRECEALQGFKPDYTRIPWRNKPAEDCPDGPRYKALGNSMAVPCMAWIGMRISLVLRELESAA